MQGFQMVLHTLHGMLYVMTETVQVGKPPPFWHTTMLYVVDALQVLRLFLQPVYGWNTTTYNIVKFSDPVFIFDFLFSSVAPRYLLFLLAFLLVSACLADSLIVARLFRAGEVTQIGPIKLLRMLVGVTVGMFFTSILNWLLIPIMCLAAEDGTVTFSEELKGADAGCKPFQVPEVFFTLPALLLSMWYAVFAITTSFFMLEINPLSTGARAQHTGRVELVFVVMKILCTFLVFLVPYISNVACATINLFLAVAAWSRHTSMLPFNLHKTNAIRGGVYGAVTWTALSTVAVATLSRTKFRHSLGVQAIQWILAACIPVAYCAGYAHIDKCRERILVQIERLRGDWEEELFAQQAAKGDAKAKAGAEPSHFARSSSFSRAASTGFARTASSAQRRPSTEAAGGALAMVPFARAASEGAVSAKSAIDPKSARDIPIPRKKSTFEKYFNPRWEQSRAFVSGDHAITVARALLRERKEEELPLLRYIMARAVQECNESESLVMFRLAVIRFVFELPAVAKLEEKRLQEEQKEGGIVGLDNQYYMYAVDQKSQQEQAASNLGAGETGVVSAIHLMEFDVGITRARKAHLSALTSLKKFWYTVRNSAKKGGIGAVLDTCIEVLTQVDNDAIAAKAEYGTLLEKYPKSIRLLHSYAAFCDIVLNDSKGAEDARASAQAIMDHNRSAVERSEAEEEEEERRLAEKQAEIENQMAKSGTSIDSGDTIRLKHHRIFLSWAPAILGKECRDLYILNWTIMCLLFLCVSVSSGAFVMTQVWLFTNRASEEVHLVEASGYMRNLAVSAAYYSRSAFVAAILNQTHLLQAFQQASGNKANHLQQQHLENYEAISNAHLMHYYSDPNITVSMPAGQYWMAEKLSFWELGNDLARRIERAATVPMEELADPTFDIGNMTESKSQLVYLSENIFRSLVPAFERATQIYEQDMLHLHELIVLVVSISTSVQCALIAFIAIVTLRGIWRTIYVMDHILVACTLAFSIPQVSVKKLHSFYSQAEFDFKKTEEGEDERDGLINETQDHGEDVAEPLSPLRSPDRASVEDFAAENVGVQAFTELNIAMHTAMCKQQEDDLRAAGKLKSTSHIALFLGLGDGHDLGVALQSGKTHSDSSDHEDEEEVQENSDVDIDEQAIIEMNQLVAEKTSDALNPLEGQLEEEEEEEVVLVGDNVGDDWDHSAHYGRDSPQAHGFQPAPDPPSLDKEVHAVPHGDEEHGGDEDDMGWHDPDAEVGGASDDHQVPYRFRNRGRSPAISLKSILRSSTSLDGDDVTHHSHEPRKKKSHKHITIISDDLHDTGDDPEKHGKVHKIEKGEFLAVKQSDENEQSGDGGQRASGDQANGRKGHLSDQLDKGGQGDEDFQGTMAFTHVPSDDKLKILSALQKKRPLYMKPLTTIAVLTLVVGLCALSSAYPAREMDALSALAPTINQGSRRLFLSRSVIYLVRELVLDDGFSRMDMMETALWLEHFLAELRRTDEAVRLGGDYGIVLGADFLSSHHNEVMYKRGCPWRFANASSATTGGSIGGGDGGHRRSAGRGGTADVFGGGDVAGVGRITAEEIKEEVRRELRVISGREGRRGGLRGLLPLGNLLWRAAEQPALDTRRAGGDSAGGFGASTFDEASEEELAEVVAKCSNTTLPGIAHMGLFQVYSTFIDAVYRVEEKYGPWYEDVQAAKATYDYQANPRPQDVLNDEWYKSIHTHPERLVQLNDDPDVKFVLECFDGDLGQGLQMIVDIFDEEVKHVMGIALEDNKLLFAVYLVTLFVLFYFSTFRRASHFATVQADKSKEFVSQIPIYKLTQLEVNTIGLYFQGEKEDSVDPEGGVTRSNFKIRRQDSFQQKRSMAKEFMGKV